MNVSYEIYNETYARPTKLLQLLGNLRSNSYISFSLLTITLCFNERKIWSNFMTAVAGSEMALMVHDFFVSTKNYFDLIKIKIDLIKKEN